MGFKNDLTSKVFGRWTVLNFDEERSSNSRKNYWICQCSCEEKTVKSVRSDQLISGHSKSCGCLNRQLASERMSELAKKNNVVKIDLSGQQFGYWTVIDRAENQNDKVAWNCVCQCGTKRVVLGQSLKNGSSQSCGCKKISRGEEAIMNLLSSNNINYKREYVIDLYFNKKANKARFDFFIEDKYFIEFDGIQHFEETSFHHGTLEERQEHDRLKEEWCKEHNFPLIRIPYTHLNDLCLEDLLLETSVFLKK